MPKRPICSISVVPMRRRRPSLRSLSYQPRFTPFYLPRITGSAPLPVRQRRPNRQFPPGRSTPSPRSKAVRSRFDSFPSPADLMLKFHRSIRYSSMPQIYLGLPGRPLALGPFSFRRSSSRFLQVFVFRHNIFVSLFSNLIGEVIASASAGTPRVYGYTLNRLFAGSRSTNVHHPDLSSRPDPGPRYSSWFFSSARSALRSYFSERQRIRCRIRMAYKRSVGKSRSRSMDLVQARSSGDSGFFKRFFVLRARDRSTSITAGELGFFFFDRMFLDSYLGNLSVIFKSLKGLPKVRSLFRGILRRSRAPLFRRRVASFQSSGSTGSPKPSLFLRDQLYAFRRLEAPRSWLLKDSVPLNPYPLRSLGLGGPSLARSLLSRFPPIRRRPRLSTFRPHRFTVYYLPKISRSRAQRGPHVRRA